MRSVGIKALKNRLSEYVRLAADGETILICDRDVVVAELRSARPARGERVADAVLADLVRRGLATPALLSGSDAHGPPDVPAAGKASRLDEVMAELALDREER